MENRATTNTFLKFEDSSGNQKLVSIDSILYDGYPIDGEDGEDMMLVGVFLRDENGDPV